MDNLHQTCLTHLQKLCVEISDRSVGSDGNRSATQYFERITSSLGWITDSQGFNAMDWIDGGASLYCSGSSFDVFVSPYSLGCDVKATLITVSGMAQLEHADIGGKLLLLYGDIAKEQLMPKNFVFYNPEEHQRIISLLERGKPAAIICATGRNASLAGGVYPFPLIEDGDFDIPSVYMTDLEGSRLLTFTGKIASLKSSSRRLPARSFNVIARKGKDSRKRIVLTAHIDAKKGTPGALDNASGVVVLLLLAGLLKDYAGDMYIEIVVLNGEDYYSVPGQMLYVNTNQSRFHEILVNINIDGAGFREGGSAFSYYGLPNGLEQKIREVLTHFNGCSEGKPWVQGDHSIFIQNGCPAIAVSSRWFTDHIDDQEITHTPKDTIELVSCPKLVEIAHALDQFIRQIGC